MKRFWKHADIAALGDCWQVTLDGRGIKTQSGRPQVVPTRGLAEALAAEWNAQAEDIDPAGFVFRDMADYALDVIAPDPTALARSLLPYAETDTLCYRGEPGEALTRRQETEWEPLLSKAEARLKVRFVRVAGIIHRPQPPETLAALGTVLAGLCPFRLAGLQTLTALSASLVIGLEALERADKSLERDGDSMKRHRPLATDADTDEVWAGLWNAACLEEDWQAELWGRDAEAEARRARRRQAFMAAARFAALATE